jgi:trehalose/maltose transport system permease protein
VTSSDRENVSRVRSESKKRRGGWFREEFGNPERRLAYYMVLPAVVIILVIAFFPIMYSVVLSVTSSTITGLGSFVGAENYIEMFKNPDFLEGLKNTVIFTVASVALEFVIGLGVALALNRAFSGRGLTRAAVLVPWAFPTVISAVMWRLMFQDQIGIINEAANAIGIISGPILADETLILIGCILVDVWKTMPFMALLLLAGLQTIPGEVYEAARVDGANVYQRFFRITLPLLKGTILVAVLFRTLDAYRVYDLFWVLSSEQLESLSTFVFKSVRISQLLFAQGNAAAVFIFVTAFLIALIFIRVFGMQTSTEE